jgi:hypothetical protein
MNKNKSYIVHFVEKYVKDDKTYLMGTRSYSCEAKNLNVAITKTSKLLLPAPQPYEWTAFCVQEVKTNWQNVYFNGFWHRVLGPYCE